MSNTLTATAVTCTIVPGMRVTLSRDTNRMRRRIAQPLTGSTFLVETFIRPSRGFARHIRKQKSRAARNAAI